MHRLPIKNSNDTYEVNPGKIIGIGLNYRDHIAEHRHVGVQGFNQEVPEEPVLFAMTPNVINAPEQPIIIPAFIDEYHFESPRIDYEAELAFIVGKHCKNVPVEKAFDYIYGYTCMNDVSQRNFQRSDKSGWFRGKSLDTFGPVGPQVVRSADIGNPQDLKIECRLNGKTVQSSNTRNMIFSVDILLAFISRNITLLPGDIVSTGTPGGVGAINHGDTVEIEIENIGILRNPVIKEGPQNV